MEYKKRLETMVENFINTTDEFLFAQAGNSSRFASKQ